MKDSHLEHELIKLNEQRDALAAEFAEASKEFDPALKFDRKERIHARLLENAESMRKLVETMTNSKGGTT